MSPSILSGPGYAVLVPAGFNLLNGDPYSGTYWLLPPGSTVMDIPAIVQIRPVQPMEVALLLQTLHQFGSGNPYMTMMNASNLGLANITAIRPVRQMPLAQATATMRDFDAVTIRGFPARVMVAVIQGSVGIVEVLVLVNLYRWVEFIGPCLQFIAGINLSGQTPSTGQIQAVIDRKRQDQVEYQLVNPDRTTTPLAVMPTVVENKIVINIDNSIKTGDINGTGIVVGEHSSANVKSGPS